MSKPRQYLVINLNKRAARMLVEFVNVGPNREQIAKLREKWEQLFLLDWPGRERDFLAMQEIVRSFWEGRKKGIEGLQIALSLGLIQPDWPDEAEPLVTPPFSVDTRHGVLFLDPHDLGQLVWLAVLQHSRRLGICQNATGSSWCHPYFIKYRARQRYCSDACAAPAKRAAKLKWWHKRQSTDAGVKARDKAGST